MFVLVQITNNLSTGQMFLLWEHKSKVLGLNIVYTLDKANCRERK